MCGYSTVPVPTPVCSFNTVVFIRWISLIFVSHAIFFVYKRFAIADVQGVGAVDHDSFLVYFLQPLFIIPVFTIRKVSCWLTIYVFHHPAKSPR